ncbi:hypothetical protein Taro_053275 [Colocasia esculenta]|uniref:Uncharacterized protein n=1 Tax=Colocasia esculenta TaxID=4460 RepID=A0A843XMN5_COLES|nr:hypothetical protein [Colocasia esculenta]
MEEMIGGVRWHRQEVRTITCWITYEGKEMRTVADKLKVVDLHVPKNKIQDIKLTQHSSTSSSIASMGDAYEQVLLQLRTSLRHCKP